MLKGGATTRVSKSVLAYTLDVFLGTTSRLLTVAIFVRYWSPTSYGDWLILLSLTEYLNVLDLGVTEVLSTKVTLLSGQRSYKRASGLFRSAFVYTCLNRLALLFVATSLMYLFPLEKWFALKVFSFSDLRTCFVFLLLYTFIGLFFRLAICGFSSVGLNGRGTALISVSMFLEAIIGIATVISGLNPQNVAGTLLAFRCISLISIFWYLGRLAPHFKLGFSNRVSISRSIRSNAFLSLSVLRTAFAAQTNSIGSIFFNQGILILIGTLFTGAAVATFATLRTIGRLLSQPWVLIARSLAPEITLQSRNGLNETTKWASIKTLQYSLWGTTGLFLVSLLIAPSFYKWWVKGALPFDATLYAVLSLSVILGTISGNCVQILAAVNQQARYCLSFVTLSGVLLLALFWVFVPGNLTQIAWGLALCEFLLTLVGIREVARIFEMRILTLAARILEVPRRDEVRVAGLQIGALLNLYTRTRSVKELS